MEKKPNRSDRAVSVGRKAGAPRSKAAADSISTSRDFARFMSQLVGDIVAGRVDPRVANAACNAGGKLLRVVEMENKYRPRAPRADGVIELAAVGG